jgi:hypothetical protein
MMMKSVLRPRWLLPILVIGLAILLVIDRPSSASDQSLAMVPAEPEATPVKLEPVPAEPEATPVKLEPVAASAASVASEASTPTPEVVQEEFDDTACGTY